MSRNRAIPVWCQISCSHCGSVVGEYYRDTTIGRLRRNCKGWIVKPGTFSEVLCPECAAELCESEDSE